MFELKKALIAILVLLMLSVPIGVNALSPPLQAQTQSKALLLSSMNATAPMGNYAQQVVSYLKQGGYNVTYLADGAITIDFLLSHMNNYSIVIWRTNTDNSMRTNYWYIGEKINNKIQQRYASDFAAGWLSAHAGVIGMSSDFIKHHFGRNSLGRVKLLIFIGSYANSIATEFLAAGVSSVVFTSGVISLQNGLVDVLTASIMNYLAQGKDVESAVYETVSPFSQGQQPQDPLDSTYATPFWYIGDGSLTIV
jgi:hypothetical protein